jgi:hypothetical protein
MRGAGSIRGLIDAAIGMEAEPLSAPGSTKKDPEIGFKISLYHCKTRYMYWKPPIELERLKDSFVYRPYSGSGHVSPEALEMILRDEGGEIKSERSFTKKIMDKHNISKRLAEESIARAVKDKAIRVIPPKTQGASKKYRLVGKKAA